jgi:predicted small lipoprotein YifL
MTRAIKLVVALLVGLLVLTGCGGKGTQTATPPAATADSGDAIPADPQGSASDSAPIDSNCPAKNTIAFAKTKFVLHSGLAFGAFHRYLWKPYQAGTFKKGASGRITAFIKGGLAALFVKREIRLATEDVKANPTLCKAIAAPLAKIGDSVKSAFDRVKTGDASGLTDVNNEIAAVTSTSKKDGVEITENENADLTSTPN